MRPWTEAFPERLEHELAEFDRLGLRFELDQDHLQATGRVLLRGAVEYSGEELRLEVVYPDSFPFMRPEVFAPDLRLERHQNPNEHNLCLLERSTLAWTVSDTGAWLVSDRVPHLLGLLEAGGEALAAAEAQQGEPTSSYFKREAGAVVFLPQEMLRIAHEHTSGVLRIATKENEPPQRLLRGCLSSVSTRDERGGKQAVAEATGQLKERFSGKTIDGRWVRLNAFPDGYLPKHVLAAAVAVDPSLAKPRWQRLAGGGDMSVVGVVVEEEVQQGVFQDAWMFVVGTRSNSKEQMQIYGAAGERLTSQDLLARLPDSARLDQAKAGVVGLGSLGAPVALELVRAQLGELRVVDFDTVESGNVARWTHGISAVGYLKTSVISGWAFSEYPFTDVIGFDFRLGAIPPRSLNGASSAFTESEGISRFVDGLDVVVDASGELGVQHLIATAAEEQGVPQVFAWGTEGGWGGAVASFVPGTGGCWMCLQLAFGDGSIALPPAAPAAPLQPRGCTDPTFAAAGFAMTPMVAQAASCVARVAGGRASTQIHVCSLQTESGELPAPAWESSAIAVHPECPCANARQ
jgi:molybdopterin/thiamine biosynthesis adenylyltransferase